MKVDLLLNIAPPAPESPFVKIENDVENGSGNKFFSEIDRALNKKEEESPKETKKSEKSSESGDNNDLNCYLSACLFAVQPDEQPKEMKLPDGSSQNALDASAGEKTEDAGNILQTGIQEKDKKENFDSEIFDKAIASILTSPNPAAIEIPAGDNLGNDAAAVVQKKMASDRLDAMNKAETEMEANLLSKAAGIEIAAENAAAKSAKNAMEKAILSIAEDSQQNSETPESITEKVPEKPLDFFSPLKSADLQESIAAKMASMEKPISSQQSNPATSRKSFNDLTNTLNAFESGAAIDASAVNQSAGKTAASNNTAEWIALKGKTDGNQENAQFKSSGNETSQDKFGFILLNVERSSGSGNSISSPAPALPLQSEELIYRLAEQMQGQLREGKGEIRIQIQPENLGTLEIRAAASANGVVARIASDVGSVREYLQNNLHVLQQSLQDQGIKIDQIQVNVQDQRQNPDHSAQFGFAGNGKHREEERQQGRSKNDESTKQPETASLESSSRVSVASGRFYTVA
jgi:flagellar hook-length control protein FliK